MPAPPAVRAGPMSPSIALTQIIAARLVAPWAAAALAAVRLFRGLRFEIGALLHP
jgi:hypothetical protein